MGHEAKRQLPRSAGPATGPTWGPGLRGPCVRPVWSVSSPTHTSKTRKHHRTTDRHALQGVRLLGHAVKVRFIWLGPSLGPNIMKLGSCVRTLSALTEISCNVSVMTCCLSQ